MNLNIQIPDNTALIFEYMQKGQFICSNSTDIDLRDMYNMIDAVSYTHLTLPTILLV